MPFAGTCSNTMALEINTAPTTSTGAPAEVDPTTPVTVVATDGSALSSAPNPADPTNPLKCVVWMADGFDGDVACRIELDADLGAGVSTISDVGIITFHDPAAANVGATVGAEVAKPA